MKFRRFMSEYGVYIYIAIIVSIFLAVVGLPVLVAAGRSLWRWALADKVFWG